MAGHRLAEELTDVVDKHVKKYLEDSKKGIEGAPREVSSLTLAALNHGALLGLVWLAGRIEKLESNPIEYAGRHYADKSYRKNQLATHNGRLWICIAGETREQPGNSPDWDMVANKGRDGKDAQ